MKKIIFLFFSLFFVLSLEAQQKTAISGKILNPKEDQVKVSIPSKYPGMESTTESTTLKNDGTFQLMLDIKEPALGYIIHGNEHTQAYFQPGKSFSVTIDTKQFDQSVEYEGKAAAPNTYLATRYLKFKDNTSEGREKVKVLDADSYRKYADKKKEEELSFLESKKASLPANFYSLAKQDIQYAWANDLYMYPGMHKYLNGIQEKLDLPENFYSFTSAVPLQNPEAIALEEYRRFLEIEMDRQFEKTVEDPENFDYSNYQVKLYEFADKKLKGEPLLFYRSNLINNTMRYEGVKPIEKTYHDFAKANAASPYVKGIKNTYDKVAKLAPGKPAPNFTLATLNGKEMSLSDLKGKVVYIDFWASWCKPCLMEMPAAKKVKEHFKNNKDIAFVYISIDDDEANWRNMIKKKEIDGIHLWSKGWASEAPKAYFVNGIPRYILVDREGKIIDSNMSRPSDEKTITRIEKAAMVN